MKSEYRKWIEEFRKLHRLKTEDKTIEKLIDIHKAFHIGIFDDKKEISWEELIIIRKWITMDSMLRIRDDYPKNSIGFKETQMIIDKWIELCGIEKLLRRK